MCQFKISSTCLDSFIGVLIIIVLLMLIISIITQCIHYFTCRTKGNVKSGDIIIQPKYYSGGDDFTEEVISI